jgi:hypothetical protein
MPQAIQLAHKLPLLSKGQLPPDRTEILEGEHHIR